MKKKKKPADGGGKEIEEGEQRNRGWTDIHWMESPLVPCCVKACSLLDIVMQFGIEKLFHAPPPARCVICSMLIGS